jgi:sporulation protein YlmC with PRC-barrel domain
MSSDYGSAIHYSAVERGTAVYDSEGERVGTVRQVVDNYREHILDGFVIDDNAGTVRFVDGPEVQRTFERAVILNIDAAAVAELGPPENSAGIFGANLNSSRLSKALGRAWKRRQ